MNRIRDKIIVPKVVRLAIIINGIELILALAIMFVVLLGGEKAVSHNYMRAVLALAALVVAWGAVVDIREAIMTRRISDRMDMVSDSFGELEKLNTRLRAQRHDFMNHLQVVYSLMELHEYDEAMKYIERTYDDIRQVSGFMKTAHPAINALLMAKAADAERAGIKMEMKLSSAWNGLPVESWAMCRVLGNLLDNAIDAMEGQRDGKISVELSEDIHSFAFRIANNGPQIPPELRERVFETGFTTKSSGTGMGLAIVSDIIRDAGGELRLASDEHETSFYGTLPRENMQGAA